MLLVWIEQAEARIDGFIEQHPIAAAAIALPFAYAATIVLLQLPQLLA